MLTDTLLDRALRWLTSQHGETPLLAARRVFEDATGVIDEAAPDYEWRIAHFFEQYLCEDDREPAAVARFAQAETSLTEDERRELAGWLRSHRALFVFEGWESDGELGRVRDLLLGGVFRFRPRPTDRQLSAGDHFDGRLVAVAGALWLSPGRVFHPRVAHAAIDDLVRELRVDGAGASAVLNGLLRMRARLLQFESIRAEHVYRLDALSEPTFAAPWARPSHRP